MRWKPGLPERRDERWFLTTDLSGTARQLCARYGKRTTIERLFRDGRSGRNGRGLRGTRVGTPDRPGRLRPVPAIACLLLCGPGLIAPKTHGPADWCPSSNERCGVSRVGLIMPMKIKAAPPQAFAAVLGLSETVAQNWG